MSQAGRRQPAGPASERTWNAPCFRPRRDTQLRPPLVADIDAAVARLLQHGAVLEMPVNNRVWGRIAGLADPFGHGIDLLQFTGRGYDEIPTGQDPLSS